MIKVICLRPYFKLYMRILGQSKIQSGELHLCLHPEEHPPSENSWSAMCTGHAFSIALLFSPTPVTFPLGE